MGRREWEGGVSLGPKQAIENWENTEILQMKKKKRKKRKKKGKEKKSTGHANLFL